MKQLQQKVKAFSVHHQLESPPEHRVLDAVSELGEVAKEILKMSDYGRKPFQFRPELEMELGDVVYSIISIANHFDIDLEQAVEKALAKYEQRLTKGGAGSDRG